MENNEQEKIEESQIVNPERILESPKKPRNKKYDFYIELTLFFILGILIGIAVKTEAMKRVTIGFDDYKMKIQRQDFNINQIEKDILTAVFEQTETFRK